MNLAHKSNKVLITGKSGTGKSTYFHRYVLNSFSTGLYDRIFIYDHQGESQIRLGCPAAKTSEDLAHDLQGGFVVFDPAELFPGDTVAGWNFFCQWCFDRSEATGGGLNSLLCCDELQMLSSTAGIEWETCLVLETGRRYSLDFCGVTQQLNLVHNRLRNQMTELVCFRQTDKLILDVLEQKGFDPSEVAALPDLHYILQNFSSGAAVRGIVTVPGKKSLQPPANEVSSDTSDEDLPSKQNSPDANQNT